MRLITLAGLGVHAQYCDLLSFVDVGHIQRN